MQEWPFTVHLGACDMKTFLKAMRKPSHDILSYASFLHPVLLKTYHIHCLEIQIFRYLELEQNYAIYQIVKLGMVSCWNKRNTVQKPGIQMEIDETFFHIVISLVYFAHWTNLSLIYGYFEGTFKLKTIYLAVFHSIYLLI